VGWRRRLPAHLIGTLSLLLLRVASTIIEPLRHFPSRLFAGCLMVLSALSEGGVPAQGLVGHSRCIPKTGLAIVGNGGGMGGYGGLPLPSVAFVTINDVGGIPLDAQPCLRWEDFLDRFFLGIDGRHPICAAGW
jgi:hypothetical protein